jgi:mannose-6-phosphate isomerase-like protein (cupin superfamily)
MLIQAQVAPRFEAGGTTVIGYASPSRGARETSVWRVSIAPGSESPIHQLEREEVFVALHGSAIATVDGQRHEVAQGDCLVVGSGVDFQISSVGEHPFEAVACMPAGGTVTSGDEAPFVPPWAR